MQAAPSLDGDKIMRLRAQTAKIEGGFARFPCDAPWLHTYLNELISFPNSKFGDQVDLTVFALAWSTLAPITVWTDESLRNLDKYYCRLGVPLHIWRSLEVRRPWSKCKFLVSPQINTTPYLVSALSS